MSRSHSLTRSVGTSRTTRCVRTSCSSGVGGRKRVNFCFMPGSLKKMQPGCPAKSIHSIVRKRLPSMQKRALAGSRQFIVQWNKVRPVNGDGTNTVTFEARLFEGSNQILFSYLQVTVVETNPVASKGFGATVGIRDVSGQSNNRNLQWSFNQAVITNGLNVL